MWFDALTLRLGRPLGGAAGAATPFNSHATLNTNLVSYWKLDETSLVRYDSVTASANDLTDNNTVGYSLAGPSGTVASFVKANSESLSKAAVIDLSGGFTAAGWLAADRFGAGAGFSLLNSDNRAFELELQVGSTPRVLIHTGDGYFTNERVIAIDTGWHHWVATYSGSSLTFYVDGTAGAPTAITGVLDSTNVLQIGDGPSGFATGSGGNVALWSRALTAPEIASLFASGNGKRYADLTTAEKVGLVSYWNLDEASDGSGAVTRNDSHGTNHLTDNGTTASATSVNGAMDGAAASFVAANAESLSVADSASTVWGEDGNGVTVVVWIYPTGTPVGFGAICGRRHSGTERNLEWVSDNNSYGASYFQMINNGVTTQTAGPALPTDQWSLAIMWFDPADKKLRVSLNNGTATESTAGANAAIDTSTAAWGFGDLLAFSSKFNGRMDEAGIWNRALTAGERTDLYAAGSGLFY